jgi:hypothetical protein
MSETQNQSHELTPTEKRVEQAMGDTGAAFQAWVLKDEGSRLQPAIAREKHKGLVSWAVAGSRVVEAP